MRAFGEEIENDGQGVRGKRRGRLQGGADIPAMAGECKEASVGEGMRGDHAERMKAGVVPFLGAEGGESMQEGGPGRAKHGHEVVAKTLAEREWSLSHLPPSLPSFLLRVRLPDVRRGDACTGRGIALQATGDMARVRLRHSIPDRPTGDRHWGGPRRPGARRQGTAAAARPRPG